MKPEDLAALAQFKNELDALDGDALIDLWIDHRDNAERTELEEQKELYVEVALAGKFGLKKWRDAVEARRKAIRNANRT